MEYGAMIQHLKDSEDIAARRRVFWVFVRADVVSEAIKQIEGADRQEVTRCRDCAYWEPENAEEGDSYGRCRNDYAPCQNQQTDMNWFCASGERTE